MFHIGALRYTDRIMRRLFFLSPIMLLADLLNAQTTAPKFVPADFNPTNYTSPTGAFQFRPLGPKYAKHDYDAYMNSIAHLQKTFTF